MDQGQKSQSDKREKHLCTCVMGAHVARVNNESYLKYVFHIFSLSACSLTNFDDLFTPRNSRYY